MWRKSRFKLIENRKNDLIWLLVHRVIRVRYALKSWGYINNDKCAICKRVETIEHCFLKCPRVVKLWEHFSPVFTILLDSPFFASPESVYYPFSSTPSSTSLMISNYLLATILYWVWFARKKQQRRVQMECDGNTKDQGQASRGDKSKDKGQDKDKGAAIGDMGKGDNSRANESKDDDRRGEKRARRSSRSSSHERRDREDEKERCERKEYEAWKEDKRREREREYSRRDYHRDRSSRRDHYYSDDDRDGWTEVSYRRRNRYDR